MSETFSNVGGRQLRLRYTFNSVCAMEDRAGMPLDRLMTRTYSPVRLIFWGGLIALQPEITIEEAGDMIGAHLKNGGTLEEIAELCADALALAGFTPADK